MDRLEHLAAKFFDGSLTDKESEELARRLEDGEAALGDFLADYELDRLLSTLHQPGSTAMVEAILAQVRREADPFVEAVAREVGPPPWPPTPAAARGTRQKATKTAEGDEAKHADIMRGIRSLFPTFPSVRRQPLALASSLALALGLGVWFFGPTMGEPVLAEVTGAVRLERIGQPPAAAAAGTRLLPGDAIVTETNAAAALAFGAERSRLDLAGGSELRIHSFTSRKRLDLRTGTLEADVARQRPFAPLVVTTPNAEAVVVGTKFILTATTNRTRLEVAEGVVRLADTAGTNAGAFVLVRAGHYAEVAAGAELGALPATGHMLREWWTNVTVQHVLDLPGYPHLTMTPDGRDWASDLEFAPVQTNRLLLRFRGHLHPPVSGDYEFWIAGSGGIRLFMSENEDPRSKVVIASNAETQIPPRVWDAPLHPGGSAWCPPVPLVAGRHYYLEALMFIPDGQAHLSVAWKQPGKEKELISGEFLSPMEPQK